MSGPRVLFFYGADAVGKSTVGWQAYELLVERGAQVAYVDTDAISFCHPRPAEPSEVIAANLGAVWATYAARGAELLVVSGIVVSPQERDRLTGAVPTAEFTFCRLTAAPETVRRRIVARREAEATTQGTELDAATRQELAAYGERSVDFGQLLERFGLEDFSLSTDDQTPREIAAEAVSRWWSGLPPTPGRP